MIDYLKKNKQGVYLYGGIFLGVVLLITLAVSSLNGSPLDSSLSHDMVLRNETAINLGFASIAWYAVFILTGIIVAGTLAYFEFKKLGWDPDALFDGFLFAVPLSIIGSRLYYVIFDPSPNYENFIDVINITQGGLAIHGAVITAIVFLIFFARKKKLNFWVLADMMAIGFLAGQIIGRWGNFMNGEAHGPVIQSQFILNVLPNFIKVNMTTAAGTIIHPTFFYEGLWNFTGLVFLLITRRFKLFKVGDMIGLYLIWYGLGRGLIIEPLRTDPLFIFGFKANILLSLTLFAGGGVLVLILKRVFFKDLNYYNEMLVTHEDNPI
ncbi:MAG: prolipoprotein diacylglyceryl transferase [Acholeplasmataceae bacterium]|nr:prolipoprotein diacylglyceryl transferase [Acholeplasmataceae bacterium]